MINHRSDKIADATKSCRRYSTGQLVEPQVCDVLCHRLLVEWKEAEYRASRLESVWDQRQRIAATLPLMSERMNDVIEP